MRGFRAADSMVKYAAIIIYESLHWQWGLHFFSMALQPLWALAAISVSWSIYGR
jgi:hypothetical protein